jgi:drug/metabolite transporter (DMT)-like permease
MSGMSHGLLMIAAALACAQGRRSLRLTGIYVGMFIPVGIALILLWDALQARNNSNTLTSILLGISGLLSFGFVALFYRLRPQEGVESRGYAVTLPRQSARPAMMIEPSPQSKAG